MMSTFESGRLSKLLDEKNLSPEQRRRILVTSVALDLIAAVVTTQGASCTLAEEMKNLSQYVAAIEATLAPAGKP